MSKDQLFDEFREVTAKEWKQKIQADLKGADYNDTLIWQSPEDINVKPFYTDEDLEPDLTSGQSPSGQWRIGQKLLVDQIPNLETEIQKALLLGAESLILEAGSGDLAFQDCLNSSSTNNSKIYIEAGEFSADTMVSYLQDQQTSESEVILLYDVIGHLTATGNWFNNQQEDMATLADLDKLSGKKKWLSVNMSRYQNAGANGVQQLAYALGHAAEYMSDNLPNLGHISFKVSIGSNYFFEIAKLRALRMLFEKLCSAEGKQLSIDILAFPTKRNKTLYDYNVNMLRTTTECMSAILGGADTICNLPYDHIYNERNEFAERIARNQLLILKSESYFDKVKNPASGSYYIESLTAELHGKAWALFEQIEAGGGFLTQLKDHKIQKKIRRSARQEQEAFDNQEIVLVGSNKYPDEKERLGDQIRKEPFRKVEKKKTLLEPIIEKRLSESLEKTRLEQEQISN